MPWSLLGILYIVCAVLCAVGFYKFVYFLSIGYGFAVAGGGIAYAVKLLLQQFEPENLILHVPNRLLLDFQMLLIGMLNLF